MAQPVAVYEKASERVRPRSRDEFIAQPTLSQQIRRLEEMVGTPLLQRRREGLRLIKAGSVLLEESRAVLSLVDQGVRRTRQASGLGRARPRFVMPPCLPEDLAVDVGVAAAVHGRGRGRGRGLAGKAAGRRVPADPAAAG
jgi:DNA-binding transcriptional LysR family regulator